MTPFQTLHGRLPPSIPFYTKGLSAVHEVDQHLLHRDALLKQLKTNLEVSVNRMKQMVDRKQRDVSFEVDSLVLLKLHPYRQQTTFKRVHQKLASHYYGPYLVLEKYGSIAYKLQLPAHSRIHPIFHMSLLKPFHTTAGQADPHQTELPPVVDDGVVILEPQMILDTRWIKHGGHIIEESLVHWKNLPTDDATWEPTEQLLAKFSLTILEDKDILPRGSNDRPRRSTRSLKPNLKYL